MDDFISGASSVEEADELRQVLFELLQTAGMTLRKWRSNDPTIRATIPEKLLETADLHLPSPLTSSETLGMHWDVARDNIHVSTPTTDSSVAITKHLVACLSAKVYDILGLFSPVTLIFKILLQELWKLQLHWDSKVPDDLATQWRQWIGDLQLILNHPIPRRLTTNSSPVIFQARHGFSNASTVAYGTAVYLRTMHSIYTPCTRTRLSPPR